MSYKPYITNKIIFINLHKPIYGSTYAIWDKWLKIAKERKLKIVVKTNEGTATFESADEYLKVAKKIKRYYKNQNEPMIFYQLDFLPFIKKREERKKIEKKLEKTDGQAMIRLLQKLKEKKPEEFNKLKGQLSLL